MTGAQAWIGRVGANWAREWARTDRSFAALTDRLVEHVVGHAPRTILDIGCGAGELTLRVAARLPEAQICAIDLSADLIAAACQRTEARGNIRFEVADAGRWRTPTFNAELLMSRHGVMFFDDPVSAFQNLHDASAPGAHMVFSCFRDRSANLWATEIAALLPPEPDADPFAPGPFAFADRARVTNILAQAGWTADDFEPVDWPYVAGGGIDPVADAVDFFTKIGPAAATIAEADGDARVRVMDGLRALAERQCDGALVTFPAAAWIVTARRR